MKAIRLAFCVTATLLGFLSMEVNAVYALCPEVLAHGLENPDLTYYSGEDPALGLAHIGYWRIDPQTLSGREQEKARKIQGNRLHSNLFEPDQIIPGHEVSGILDRAGRRQWMTLRLPDDWNGSLVVCGTPGLRNEYANETVLMPWLMARGYAVIAGDKGLANGWVSMLSGTHPTRHWGRMMHDLAVWAKYHLALATGRRPRHIYAVGLSNGGYQVRRALEIDATLPRWRRIFDGGLDWSGTYFPSRKVLDTDNDGRVSVPEYAAANTLIAQMDTAVQTMKWAYAPDTVTTPGQYHGDPRFAAAQEAMQAVGFNSPAAIFWGLYNTNYDAYKNIPGFEPWKGVGYYNLTSYVYRAELLGHDLVRSADYSCFIDPGQPDLPPPLYGWLEAAENGGWTPESVQWALANANTGKFVVPMITVVGGKDGLLPIRAHAEAYRQAVEAVGKPRLYRQYLIENGPHVDADADGGADFDFDGIPGNEGAEDELTPMQPYVQRAFDYLVDWVRDGRRPPRSQTVAMDPVGDAVDPDALSW